MRCRLKMCGKVKTIQKFRIQFKYVNDFSENRCSKVLMKIGFKNQAKIIRSKLVLKNPYCFIRYQEHLLRRSKYIINLCINKKYLISNGRICDIVKLNESIIQSLLYGTVHLIVLSAIIRG